MEEKYTKEEVEKLIHNCIVDVYGKQSKAISVMRWIDDNLYNSAKEFTFELPIIMSSNIAETLLVIDLKGDEALIEFIEYGNSYFERCRKISSLPDDVQWKISKIKL